MNIHMSNQESRFSRGAGNVRVLVAMGDEMAFENLTINRVVLHEVFRRLQDGSPVPPRCSDRLVDLPAEAKDVFKERVVDAMGTASQSMELAIIEAGAESAVKLASQLVGTTDEVFVAESAKFAHKLVAAQLARNLPGGVLVIFDGTVTAASLPFVAVIKAEKQTGFRERGNSLQFFKDLFLTPASKLYKIGFFLRLGGARQPINTAWKAHVYDSHMTTANREGAAKYFYELFLGCGMPENSARLTKAFFEHTREFILALPEQAEVKDDLLTSLYTYLKVDQTPTIQVNTFSTSYLSNNYQDRYSDYMNERNFPLVAVQKDTAELKGQLRKRRVQFSGSIELSAPPESFQDLITMETIPADGDPVVGGSATWTRIVVKDRIRMQQ